jgi:flagellar biogenesis protein FliO
MVILLGCESMLDAQTPEAQAKNDQETSSQEKLEGHMRRMQIAVTLTEIFAAVSLVLAVIGLLKLLLCRGKKARKQAAQQTAQTADSSRGSVPPVHRTIEG